MVRENFLLDQIDEFREKAKELEELLLSKESKVEELQNIVDEREVRAQELQMILEERQKQAESVSSAMTEQLDQMIARVSLKISEIKEEMCVELENGKQFSETQSQEIRDILESVKTQLEDIKSELTEKVHTENVKCYRNVAELFKGIDFKLDKIEFIEGKTDTVGKSITILIILTAINLLGMVALTLFESGVLKMFFK